MDIYILDNGCQLIQGLCSRLDANGLTYTLIVDYRGVPSGSILIGMYDFFIYDVEAELVKHCKDRLTYIRCLCVLDQAYLGPVIHKGSPCTECMKNTLIVNNPEHPMLLMNNMTGNKYQELPWSAYFTNLLYLKIKDTIQELQATGNSRLSNRVLAIKQYPLQITAHRILKDEYCSMCSSLEEDSPEKASITIAGGRKVSPVNHRLKDVPQAELLKLLLVDMETGKYKHIYKDLQSKYIPLVGTESYGRHFNIDRAFGRSFNYESAKQFALLESLERYSNINSKKSRSMIFGSYRRLKENAIDPRKLGLHQKEQTTQKGFSFLEYTDDLEFYWIWGWSVKENRPILIPEQMIYYGDNLVKESTNRFVYETSNGCALGSTQDEAMLYGLLEMIERDNFLVAWYNKLPLTEIDLEATGIMDILEIKIYLESQGYRLHFFDISMELRIPSIWGIIINEQNQAVVRTYSAAGAHFNPENALRGALIEVVTSMPVYETVFTQPELLERRERMFRDDTEVTEFQDHVLLYSHPEALERFKFLFDNSKGKRSLYELYPEWYKECRYQNQDLKDDIEQLLEAVLYNYEDVYVADLTGELLQVSGLHCVKVLVPGMLTMSFGHQYRRIVKERVLWGPVQAGRTSTPIEEEEINHFPHPFP
ncbi:hypothetical protein DNH61_25220 [Paenibacillus sambharensis]|uniref:YcaO domain-containing protein n=1 Tax=Paenibacillus sambharensis TaxID=1803190 RepID=A0A2W1L201_9BACL|nr:TOMM precursor leader peptide-binding protein [Paenibacillus sambharensis]PZD93083.1 hypothetical protein DNH61_25220 [Paenibacillus sambharensis]